MLPHERVIGIIEILLISLGKAFKNNAQKLVNESSNWIMDHFTNRLFLIHCF